VDLLKRLSRNRIGWSFHRLSYSHLIFLPVVFLPDAVDDERTEDDAGALLSGAAASDSGSAWRRWTGLGAGLALFAAVLASPAPDGLSPDAWTTAGVGLLMACWWITEALPIAATSLVPLVFFPVLGIRDVGEAASPYANPLIFLFMGGFIIAVAMQRWNLHRRVALAIVQRVGTRPERVVIGFIIACALLSMWVSNTATALMMLPTGLSVIEITRERLQRSPDAPFNFGVVLVLAIAYACNIGGVGTLIGTPPNAILAGFASESYGIEIGFAQWMTIGVPVMLVLLPLMYLILIRVFPIAIDSLPGGSDVIEEERQKLGPLSTAETRVAIVFGATAALWIFRPLLSSIVPGLSDAGIAMTASLILFALPAGGGEDRRILTWEEAERLPWGVLLIFGGGLSLASAIEGTGLAAWIGEGVGLLAGWPALGVVLVAVALIVFLTEITSNTATTATFLPILGAIAIGIGQNPLLLAVPAAMAASCAFMLPVATPPNAIVYGSNLFTIPQMSRAGLWINVVSIVLVTALAYALLGLVFGVELGVVPGWATR